MAEIIRSLPAKVPMTLDELVGAMEWNPPPEGGLNRG